MFPLLKAADTYLSGPVASKSIKPFTYSYTVGNEISLRLLDIRTYQVTPLE